MPAAKKYRDTTQRQAVVPVDLRSKLVDRHLSLPFQLTWRLRLAIIEKRYLAPLNPSATIEEADRRKVYDLISKHLADTFTGSQSYFPEGPKKDPRTLASDLADLIDSLSAMQMRTNDPHNILGEAIAHLKGHAERFGKVIDDDEPVDQIELPREQTPTTRDNNFIYVDPDPGPYSPPNPLLPQHRPLDRRIAFGLPDGGAVAATPETYRQLASPIVNSTPRRVPRLNQTVSQQTLELLNGPTPKRPFPPIFDTRGR